MEDAGLTAGLVAVVLALVEVIKRGVSKANGGTDLALLQAQVASLTTELEGVKAELSDFRRDFGIMRESFNIFLAVEKAKDTKGD